LVTAHGIAVIDFVELPGLAIQDLKGTVHRKAKVRCSFRKTNNDLENSLIVLQQENRSLKEELEITKKELECIKTSIQMTENRLSVSDHNLDTTRRELHTTKDTLNQTVSVLHSTQMELEETLNSLAIMKEDAESRISSISEKDSLIETKCAEMEQLNQRFQESQQRTARIESELNQLIAHSAVQPNLGSQTVVEKIIPCANKFKDLRDNDLVNLVFSMSDDDEICQYLFPLISIILFYHHLYYFSMREFL
jgi:chromosome segregation ATPase